MANELERQGIPAVLITTLVPVARSMYVNRFVAGISIEHVVGRPDLPPAAERRVRRQVVEKALAALTLHRTEE